MKKIHILLFVTIFGIKLALVIWVNSTFKNRSNTTFLSVSAGDTFTYIEPFHNLKINNEYFFLSGSKKVYAGRLPFYGSIFYCFDGFISDNYIFNLYVLIQLALESLAIILLSLLVQKHFWKSKLSFWFSICFLTVSFYMTTTSMYLIPESMGMSILIFILYIYRIYLNDRASKQLIYLSILLTILVGLKPYFGVLFVFISIELIWFSYIHKLKLKKVFLTNLTLFSCLLIFTISWSYRNYNKTNKFIPLTQAYSGMFIPPSLIALRGFLSCMGESSEYWDRKAMGSFFYSYPGSLYTADDIPKSKYYNNDSVEILQKYFSNLTQVNFSKDQDALIVSKIHNYKKSFVKENLGYVYTYAPAKLVLKFIFHSGSYYLPFDMSTDNSIQKSFKLLQTLLYYCFLIFGFIGLALKRDYFLLFIPLFLILLFPITLGTIELRFFTYAYPSLILGMFYLIGLVHDKIKKL